MSANAMRFSEDFGAIDPLSADSAQAPDSTSPTRFLDARVPYEKFEAKAAPPNHASAAPGTSQDHPQFVGDAIGDTIGTASSLGMNTSITTLIDSIGDHDVFSISLTAGQTYTFSMERTDWSSGIDSYLEVLNSGGTQVAFDDDGGIYNNSQITFVATYTGTYYLNAHTYADSSTGQYVLTTNTLEIGNTSPTTFTPNGHTMYSWEQAAFQINRDFQTVNDPSWQWPGSQGSWAPRFETPAIVTYAFRSSAPGTMPEDTSGFSQFNAAQIAAAQAALAAWASVANIVFVRVDQGDGYSGNASILFGNYSAGASAAAAFAYIPVSGDTTAGDVEGDVWVNSTLSYNSNPVIGDYGQQVLLHEIGHALGLNHPGDYNAGVGGPITYANSAEYFNDTRMFTVMSYFGPSETGGNLALYAALPQLHDIAAIQHLYGANMTTRTGDTVYGYNSNTGLPEYALTSTNQAAVFSIWDAGGNDTLDLSGYTTANTIDLRQEAFSSVGGSTYNISIARGSVIENAFGGSGSDTIIGNSVANVLNGNGANDTLTGDAGNDSLNGGTGSDTMVGGLGDDVYYVDNLSDVITENSSEGTDAVLVTVSGYTMAANLEIGAVSGGLGLTLTGNGLSNILYGAAGGDALNGGDGDDTLQGGGGADTMNGGLGNDTFYVAQAGDTVVEASGQGTDATIVQMTGPYTLAANVEIGATFLGTGVNITGNGLDNQLYGNAGADTLNGAGGNDFIQGAGGSDSMIGGTGNDTYFLEDAGDTITENSNEGSDAVIVFTSSYTLTANVEVGARFLTTAYTLTGNGLDNQLYGNNGADTLNGGDGNDTIQGGAGNDTMIGGLGNDTFFVEQAGDVVTENSNEGNDAVLVLIGSYTLAANVEVGAAFLTTGVALTGNGLDNKLYGNIGADTLSGAAGADLLDGGAGADTLTGGTENDVFVFVAGQGNGDTVTDFAGNGAAAGDSLRFAGYGTTGGGASFMQLDATHWQINSADGTIHDTITLANSASVDVSDWMFI